MIRFKSDIIIDKMLSRKFCNDYLRLSLGCWKISHDPAGQGPFY